MRIIHINSAQRDYSPTSTDSDFDFTLNYPIQKEDKWVVLLCASIPKTYYLINAGNSFTLIEGAQSVSISMPVGNYTINSFTSVMQTVMQQASPNHYLYSITNNFTTSTTAVVTGKLVFTVSAMPNGAAQPQFAFNGSLYEQMGFADETTYTFSGNTLTAPNLHNMNLESTLFIHSDICQNMDDNVLQEIYTTSNVTNLYISFTNKMPHYYFKHINAIGNTFHFSLTDEYGHNLNLNGINMNLTICLSETGPDDGFEEVSKPGQDDGFELVRMR